MKNLTAAPSTITKGVKVTQVVAANAVPQMEFVLGKLEKLDEIQSIQQTRISVEARKQMFLQQLELSGLEGWSHKNQAVARVLLAEYQNIFSLQPGQLGCTHLVKHEIRVTDDEPFKERFWRIPQPMVDEVHAHVKEMLEAGTIHPYQSPLGNAIVLVCRKD